MKNLLPRKNSFIHIFIISRGNNPITSRSAGHKFTSSPIEFLVFSRLVRNEGTALLILIWTNQFSQYLSSGCDFCTMATTIVFSTLPVKLAAAFECNLLPRHGHLLNRHTLPLPDASGRRLGCSSSRSRGIQVVKSQKKDDEGGVKTDPKPFYAALKFWIQVAVVVLTFGFLDAG